MHCCCMLTFALARRSCLPGGSISFGRGFCCLSPSSFEIHLLLFHVCFSIALINKGCCVLCRITVSGCLIRVDNLNISPWANTRSWWLPYTELMSWQFPNCWQKVLVLNQVCSLLNCYCLPCLMQCCVCIDGLSHIAILASVAVYSAWASQYRVCVYVSKLYQSVPNFVHLCVINDKCCAFFVAFVGFVFYSFSVISVFSYVWTTVWVKKIPPPWGFLTFFPRRLGIFSPNFTRLLCVPIYARVRIFILQLWRSYAILSATTEFTSCAQNVHHRPKHTRSDVSESRW